MGRLEICDVWLKTLLMGRVYEGKTDREVALCVRDSFSWLDLNDGGNRVECLWLRIRVKANNVDVMVGVC